jgi:hypothetical protein
MSNDIIEHTVTLQIPESMWSKTMEGFRALRKLHQSAGGSSRLVKDGDKFTFTAKGPSTSVLDAIKNTDRLQQAVSQARESTVDFLRETLRRGEVRREQRKDEFLGMVADEILKQKKGDK